MCDVIDELGQAPATNRGQPRESRGPGTGRIALENSMSSFGYGLVTAKRASASAGQSQSTAAPGLGTYIDALAALVPAEALALYAGVVVPYATHTASVNGKNMTVISDPRLLQWSCAGLLALSSLLYLVGRQNGPFIFSDVVRFLIPPMAFTAWMLVQNLGVWDVWWHGSSLGERTVIAAFGAVLLGVVASLLGQLADNSPGVLAVKGVKPETGPVAGGTHLTVTGTGFTGVTVVKFGQVPARDLVFVDDTRLTVTSPQAGAGTVDVTVTTPAGTSPIAEADHFTYGAAAAASAAASAAADISPAGISAAGISAADISPAGSADGETKTTVPVAAGAAPPE